MTTRNLIFVKAIFLLTRPASVAALLVLLLNDHLLRRLWPSWWTGKLGDAAWLFFIPFILAAFLAWLVPGGAHRREQRVFGLAFLTTAVIFSLTKTLPAVHSLVMNVLSFVLDSPIALRRDPSDLLALPVLALSWQLYRSTAAGFTTASPAGARLHPAGLTALVMAALLTIANMAQPNPGIACLSSDEQGLRASTSYQSYSSSDGGLTWQPNDAFPADCATSVLAAPDSWQTLSLSQSTDLVRYRSGQPIERSTDGGQTWQTFYQPKPISDAGKAYLLKSHTGNPYYVPGPLDAVEDTQTGNLVFAMGYEGILTHTSDGSWQWAEAGENRTTTDFPDWNAFWLLLGGEAWLAIGAGLLVFAWLAMRWLRAPARLVVLVLATLAWLGVAWVFPPATNVGYGAVASGMGTLAVAVLLIPLVIEMTIQLIRRRPAVLLPLAGIGVAAALLFFLPFGLWVLGALPGYIYAAVFAMLLVLSASFAGWRLSS